MKEQIKRILQIIKQSIAVIRIARIVFEQLRKDFAMPAVRGECCRKETKMIGQHIVRIEKQLHKPMSELGNAEFLDALMNAFEEAVGQVRIACPDAEVEDRTPAPKVILKEKGSKEERQLWFITAFFVTPVGRKGPTDCYRVFLDLSAPVKQKQGDESDDTKSTSVSS